MSMRKAFAACMAFFVLMVVVAIRFGFRESPPDEPTQSIVDAAIADAPLDGPIVVPDAAPPPKKQAPKPKPKATQPKPKPTPKPTPIAPTPVPPTPVIPTPLFPSPIAPSPGQPGCRHPANPAGCPAKEPNVNRPCDAEGVQCIYGTSCCPFIYVCKNGAFEAWFQTCP